LRRIPSENQNIQGGERLNLLQIGLFSLWKENNIVEAGASSSLFTCETGVNFSRITSCKT
jgi:hypothetical protein